MPESSFDETIEIAAPPEEVFEWLVDRERVARWCVALGAPASFADSLPADRSEMRAGYSSETPVETRGGEYGQEVVQGTALMEVTGYEPPTSYATHSRHPDHDTRDTYTLEPTASGTSLRHQRTTEFTGMAAKGMEMAAKFQPGGINIYEKYARDHFERSLQTLKELIEAS